MKLSLGFVPARERLTTLGLNVEQRKRLTIAVELAARPELLLFLGKVIRG